MAVVLLVVVVFLVLLVAADHPHRSLAADDLTVLTNPLDTGSYFHGSITLSARRFRRERRLL